MESIPSNSLIENSYNQYDYSYRNGESNISIPSIIFEKKITTEKSIDFEDINFKKISKDKIEIFVLTKDKKKFKSNEITFSKFKKRNDIKYEDIDTFIREVNNINKNEKNIDYEFSVYLDKETTRIKYRYLKKNNNNVEIVFIVRDENSIKNNNNNIININNTFDNSIENEINNKYINQINFNNNNNNINQINFNNNNNDNNNILNDLSKMKNEIEKLSNLYLNFKEKNIKIEKIEKIEKLSNLNHNLIKNYNQIFSIILTKKESITKTISKLFNKDQSKIELDLLFSLQRDGNDIEKFHKLVNNIKPTLLFFEIYNRKYYFYYINESWENENINNDYQIKTNDKMFLYCFNDKKKLLENKQLAIYCCNNYGPMIGEYYKNDVDFINNLDFDCSLSLEKVFTSKKDIFTTANNYNQFYLKELEIYKLNIYN